MDDATLVSRAVGGDRDAFAAIYDRYAGAVLDLCTAVVRDPGQAEEATLDSFLRAARELVNLRDRSRLRMWLLAVARHEATTRDHRGRGGVSTPAGAGASGATAGSPTGGTDARGWDPGNLDSVPETGTDDRAPGEETAAGPYEAGGSMADDARPLVWDSSESLSERDRALLHLHLRHQLAGDDLGAVLGLRPAVAESRAARLRSRTETSVGALLLTRADSGADPSSCRGLAEVLEGWDGRFTPSVGARVDRHVRRCDACRDRRTMLLGRLRAMASLPFLPPPPWLRQEVLLRMELAVSSRTLVGWDEQGFPPGIDGSAPRPGRRGGRRSAAVAAAVVLVAVVAGVGYVLVRDDDGGSTVSASSGSSTSSTPATTGRPSSSVVGSPPSTSVTATSTSTPNSGPTTTGAPGPIPPSPTQPGPAPMAPPVFFDLDPPAIAFGADAASAYTYPCPYSSTAVTAEVTDQSPVDRVALFVIGPDGVEESVAMAPDGGRWRASIGAFNNAGQAIFWVEAIDSEGNRSRAADQVLDVYPCE